MLFRLASAKKKSRGFRIFIFKVCQTKDKRFKFVNYLKTIIVNNIISDHFPKIATAQVNLIQPHQVSLHVRQFKIKRNVDIYFEKT